MKGTAKINIDVPNDYSQFIQRAIDAILECAAAADQIGDTIKNKYKKKVKFYIELIAERAVDKFYESYDPSIYSRKEDLYNAYKVIVDDAVWKIETDASYMKKKHQFSNEYIFWNSFQNGFHGGAVDGPGHPDPGTPWWKFHGRWYKPAASGPQIESAIIPEVDAYVAEQAQAMVDEYDTKMQPFLDKVIDAINTLKMAIRR